jgi:hypothetical protein
MKDVIWHFAQNKPSLIADDLEQYVDRDIVMASLLRRGVFKWLAVRRDLIRLKNTWKGQITDTLNDMEVSKKEGKHYHRAYLRGYRTALNECREDVRRLCHSDRWQAPDFCKESREFLNRTGF